ncbi:MAG: hypothetical protein SFY80_14420 [Verrucomicrobiota bacterium]|nr:hypothetical protein [Verrucomicrobiota bacterium]
MKNSNYSIYTICLLISLMTLTSCSNKYEIGFQPGSMQVLSTGTEVWVFFQLDRLVRHPGHVYDAPSVYAVGYQQEIIVFNRNGLKNRVKFIESYGLGPQFHPNYSYIYRNGGTFYLYKDESADNLTTLYGYDGNQFKRLPFEDAIKIRDELSPIFFTNQNSITLDRLTETDGWKYQGNDTGKIEMTFNIEGYEVKIQSENKDGYVFLLVTSDNYFSDNKPIRISYPIDHSIINSKEYKRIKNEPKESGYPKS